MLPEIVEMLEAFDAISVSLELMLEALVEMLEVLDAMSVSFDAIAAAFVAISVSLDVMFAALVLILDSTSVKSPKANVPSISASLSIVTVPLF